MAKKSHHGPTDPNAGKRQARELDLKSQRETERADKAKLDKWIDHAKVLKEQRQKREARVQELAELRHQKRNVLRRYG